MAINDHDNLKKIKGIQSFRWLKIVVYYKS